MHAILRPKLWVNGPRGLHPPAATAAAVLSSVSVCTCATHDVQLLTFGRRLTPAELFARVDAVDASAVKAVAQRFIEDKVPCHFLASLVLAPPPPSTHTHTHFSCPPPHTPLPRLLDVLGTVHPQCLGFYLLLLSQQQPRTPALPDLTQSCALRLGR